MNIMVGSWAILVEQMQEFQKSSLEVDDQEASWVC